MIMDIIYTIYIATAIVMGMNSFNYDQRQGVPFKANFIASCLVTPFTPLLGLYGFYKGCTK